LIIPFPLEEGQHSAMADARSKEMDAIMAGLPEAECPS
jgi:hypothetical protein